MVLPITDVLLLLQRGYVDVGFMGGAQIDRFGNLNSSFIGDADNPKIRLPGTGGGNDISSLTDMIVAMKHEKRRFVTDVDFITSPGWINGRRTRAEAGLPQGGMWRVVTDLAILGFDAETREMKVLACSRADARAACRRARASSCGSPRTSRRPSRHARTSSRSCAIDPERLYTGYEGTLMTRCSPLLASPCIEGCSMRGGGRRCFALRPAIADLPDRNGRSKSLDASGG